MKLLIYLFLLFPHIVFSEGFVAGTLVKTPIGYTCIENLSVGDVVTCFDNKKNLVQKLVVDVTKKYVTRYAMVNIGGECIATTCDQKFYNALSGLWVSIEDLKINDVLSMSDGNTCSVEYVEIKNEPIDVYRLSIAEHHNYFVSRTNVWVHNFPVVVIEICAAFGAGVIEFVSASFGLAGLGAYFGYQIHKKNKQNNVVIGTTSFGTGMMPNDPEDENEKKRNRNKARENFQPLTNKEARDAAEKHGYREVKSHPCGDTRNKPVFTNGKQYISPDKDGHNGGAWKVFNRHGKLQYSISKNLDVIVKVY